jgi:hypothetical protein
MRTRSDRSLRNPAPGNPICTKRQSSAASMAPSTEKGVPQIGSGRYGSPPFGSSLADARSRPHKHTRPMTPWSEGLKADRLTDARWACPAGAGSNLPSLRRGSGYEQAKPKLRCIESDEVAVAFGPLA